MKLSNSSYTKAGTYEVIIADVSEGISYDNYLLVKYIIRDDIKQPCQGNIVYERIYKKSNPTEEDKFLGGYSFKRISWLGSSVGISPDKDFQNISEIITELLGGCLKIEVVMCNGYPRVGKYFESDEPHYSQNSVPDDFDELWDDEDASSEVPF